MLAINPDLVDMDKANTEFPPFPEFTVNTGAVHTAFFFRAPGSVHGATKSGTWGDARGSTRRSGERYLQIGVRVDAGASSTTSSAPSRPCRRADTVRDAEAG